MEPIFKELTAARKFGMLVFIFSVSYLTFYLLSGIILVSSTGIQSQEEFMAALTNGNEHVILMAKMAQLLASIGAFVVPAHVFSLLSTGDYKTYFGFEKIPAPKNFLFACLAMFCAMPLINAMVSINEAVVLPSFLSDIEKWMRVSEESNKILTEQFLKMDSVNDLLLNLLVVALIPAIGEEMLFRGAIQKTIIEWTGNIHKGIWISAIVFSFFHFQFYGFLPRMMMGAMLGYMMVWNGSVLLPAAAHFTNNAAAVVLSYLIQKEYLPKNIEEVGSASEEIIYIIISIVIVGACMFRLYKNRSATSELQS